ncbi:Aste57867_9025 [Aphanomyces stellatus]|uniref:Aste57867_9025 protein n=1 Tax=Aphanomyces stellatus TaxID=120398 RepID=A0A485KLW1_9STRA|nr:hypothetical protein As57867_008989 [Aphanomyces stellatus]VFT85909.1 Aste57867_9025 [Aphanomyces stellatus]
MKTPTERSSLIRVSNSVTERRKTSHEHTVSIPQCASMPDLVSQEAAAQTKAEGLFKIPPLRRDYDPSMAAPASHYGIPKLSMDETTCSVTSVNASRSILESLPSVMIAVVLNLMISIPFGLSFFPLEWTDLPAPRAVGIQMFLLTTIICQFVFAARSSFDCSVGMMMVENVPFMHTLSMSILEEVGHTSPKALPTILVTYAISSIVVGVLFYVLGHFRLGSIIYLFPKHIIIGAIGGIGIFVVQNGLQNATGISFEWTWTGLVRLSQPDVVWLWVVSVILVFILGVCLRFAKSPLFSPFYFVSIVPLFYVALLLVGIPFETARANGWFFDHPPQVPFYSMWEDYDFSLVEWSVIPKQFGTLVGLSIFSLMHVPINIPSLSLTTGHECDINEELKAHGISNTLGGLVGSVQNYLCYSTSALYYKCGGGGRLQSVMIGGILSIFFFTGPSVVAYVPRCMAGCLMVHVGLDLCKEAVVDTYAELDRFEYATVWIIALTMTFWGMNEGLAVGALLACITFVAQSAPAGPLRGSMSAATLRSSAWRSTADLETLDRVSRNVHVVQLKGHLFFGNIHKLSEYIANLLESYPELECMVVDFTLVVAMDSSAADRLAKLKHVCAPHECRLVFTAIPSTYTRFRKVMLLNSSPSFHVADDLNSGIEWIENELLLHYKTPEALTKTPSLPKEHAFLARLHNLCPNQPLTVLQSLLAYFERREMTHGTQVWRQGDNATSAMLLAEGHMQAIVEEEAGTKEDISAGSMVGELCLLTGEKRKTSVVTTERCVVYILTEEKFKEMLEKDSFLAFVFQGIALRYVSQRLQYVGNRIWETKCLPI